jgi:hypothetical protein
MGLTRLAHRPTGLQLANAQAHQLRDKTGDPGGPTPQARALTLFRTKMCPFKTSVEHFRA